MYQTYIFDLYGTLVDIHTDENKADLWEKMSLFYAFYGACYTAAELRHAYESLTSDSGNAGQNTQLNAHEAHPEIQIEHVFAQLFKQKGISPSKELPVHAGQFFRILSIDYVKLYDGALELLADLKSSGKKVYLLSNAQRIFTAYELRAMGIDHYFDDIFISSDYGVKKPDLRFFNQLLEKHQIAKDGAVMIGNDGQCDIMGAKAAGIASVYIHSNLSPDEPMPPADHILPEMNMAALHKILLTPNCKV